MRIYFENHPYDSDQIKPYLDKKLLYEDIPNHKCKTDRIGYIFVSNDAYSGPVFILPKTFLIEVNGKLTVLGLPSIFPEDVIDTDDEDNPLKISGKGSFLPELGIWLYRALSRFRDEHEGTKISEQANLDSQLPENCARDKDFLSTALDLIDYLKDHRNLFTQISIINHSGRDKIDWSKTVKNIAYIKDDEAWYLDPAIKDKSIDIDDTLIILYYSVLQYLRDKYSFPINLGDVPYTLLSPERVQRLIDTGIGSKEMRRIRHKYFRDELKALWVLLDSFFTYNNSDNENIRFEEHILVKNFEIIFEAMVDSVLSDVRGVEDLREQEDGKLIDHIFRFTSLIGNDSDIYFIGDSKYYPDNSRPEGVALYKQFTYAKNTIQYHIDRLYLTQEHGSYPFQKKGDLRYRDTLTEGYNITPNFFVRSRVESSDIDFSNPYLKTTIWDKKKHQEHPKPNQHFPNRLFDRDTLILREFSINLLFVIASYAGYEDGCWSTDLHKTIRKSLIDSIDKEYEFFKVTPTNLSVNTFYFLYISELIGKAYALKETDDHIIIAFEKNEIGKKDKEKFDTQAITNLETGEVVTYTIEPISLHQLSEEEF